METPLLFNTTRDSCFSDLVRTSSFPLAAAEKGTYIV